MGHLTSQAAMLKNEDEGLGSYRNDRDQRIAVVVSTRFLAGQPEVQCRAVFSHQYGWPVRRQMKLQAALLFHDVVSSRTGRPST